MPKKVDIPGSGQSIDLSSGKSTISGFLMAVLAFMLTAAAGSLGVKLYNKVAENTPDQFQTVDII